MLATFQSRSQTLPSGKTACTVTGAIVGVIPARIVSRATGKHAPCPPIFLQRKKRANQNGICNCIQRGGDDGTVCVNHRALLERRLRLWPDLFRASTRAVAAVLSGFGMLATGKVFAKLGGRLAENALEHTIELSERLKPDIVGDFTNPTIWI
jgi:hypothetical protein